MKSSVFSSRPELKFFALLRNTSFVTILSLLPTAAHAVIKITPQRVVEEALSKGRAARAQDLNAQRSYLQLANARGLYDLQFTLIPGYQYNEAPNLTGTANLLDRTLTLQAVLSKKFITGTTLTLEYDSTRQASTLSAFNATSNRPSSANLDVFIVGVRQPLLRDAFGYSDRLIYEIAEDTVRATIKMRDENIETVALNAMTLFWNTYIAEQSLKENLSARDKYVQLVANVRRKAGFNLATPGELPRLEAEMELTDERVKTSSSDYLNAVDSLLTAMQLQTREAVELDVPSVIPPVPKLEPKDIETLRSVEFAKTALLNAQRNQSNIRNLVLPQVDLIARAASTGEAEDVSRSYSQMLSTKKPTYYIGLEIKASFDSYITRGQIADAAVQLAQGENDLGVQRDTLRDQMLSLQRQVNANFAVAGSSVDAVKQRERVVRDLEVAYRQGRQSLVELIRAYNDLFTAQLDRARAIGNYHISLNQLAAARDELLVTVQ
jgi:outer membrane protein TolC